MGSRMCLSSSLEFMVCERTISGLLAVDRGRTRLSQFLDTAAFVFLQLN